MPTLLSDPRPADVAIGSRELLVIWQNPMTNRFRRAGTLSVSQSGYRFEYDPEVGQDPDFFPLDEYPLLSEVYESQTLPAFFANRVMSSERESYEKYLGWLGLDRNDDALAVEMLIRTGGTRATDTFHVIEQPPAGADRFTSRFFVSGIRHQDGGAERVQTIKAGDILMIEAEPENATNANAHLVLKSHDEPIGWIPDWLCGEVAEMGQHGWRFNLIAEQVNAAAPTHVQVLCRFEAQHE